MLQRLATDLAQSGSAGAPSGSQQQVLPSGSAKQTEPDSCIKAVVPIISGSFDAEVDKEVMMTPAASSEEAKPSSTAAKSGSKSAWFGKAGGLLNRWAVPVKVKKEPRSNSKLGVADVIDLT